MPKLKHQKRVEAIDRAYVSAVSLKKTYHVEQAKKAYQDIYDTINKLSDNERTVYHTNFKNLLYPELKGE